MRKPTDLPTVEDRVRDEFLHGWWAGITVGFVCGVAVCVMVAQHLGKL